MDYRKLERDLNELEREDPAVAEAARRIDEARDSILARGDIPRRKFTPSPTQATR